MADTLLRLRVDSQEYDSKLKNASEGIKRYAQNCKDAGGTLKYLDEGVLEFVKSLGQMDTASKSSKGQLREMTQALTDLTSVYRNLSDEEKSSDFGKELSKGLANLTERAGKVKDAMIDVNAAISNASSDTRAFDQLTQGIGLMTSGFQTATGAAKLLGINLGDNLEVIAKLQAAMAVTNGLTQAQTALQKQSALMQGVMAVQAKAAAAAIALEGSNTKAATIAQAAFNAVAKANPYVLLASAVAAVGTALLGFTGNAKKATDSIKTETEAMKQAQHMADTWKNSLSSTFASLMTKYDEMKRQWVSLKSEHQRTEWIKQNEQALKGLGLAVNDVKTAEEFFNGNTDAVVQSFVRRAQAAARVAQLTELYRKQIELIDKKERTQQSIMTDAAKYGRSANAGDEIKDSSYWNSRYGSVDSSGKWRFSEAGAKLYSGTDTSTADAVVKIDVELEANEAEINKVKNQIEGDFGDVIISPKGGGGKGGGDKTEEELVMLSEDVRNLDQIALKLLEGATQETTKSLNELQVELAKYKQMLGNATTQEQYNTAKAGIASTQNKIAVQSTAFEMGISVNEADFKNQMQGLKDDLESYFKENPLTLEIGGAQKLKKEAMINEEAWNNVASALQSASSAFSAFDEPGLNVAATIATALANVAMAFSKALSGTATPWDFIAGVAGGLAAMASAVAAIKSVGKDAQNFAEGGIVQGNSYSGDNIPIMANAGEVVLSRAQVGTLASSLQGGGGGGSAGVTHAIVSADTMRITLQNGAKKSGKTMRDYLQIG